MPPVWKYTLPVAAGISARARATHASCGRVLTAECRAASRSTGTTGAAAAHRADCRRNRRRSGVDIRVPPAVK